MSLREAPSEEKPDLNLINLLTKIDPNKDIIKFIQGLTYQRIFLTLQEIINAGAKSGMPPEDARIVRVGKIRTKPERRPGPHGTSEIVSFPILLALYSNGTITWQHFPNVDL